MKPHVHTRQAEGGWSARARFRRSRDTNLIGYGKRVEDDWEEVRLKWQPEWPLCAGCSSTDVSLQQNGQLHIHKASRG